MAASTASGSDGAGVDGRARTRRRRVWISAALLAACGGLVGWMYRGMGTPLPGFREPLTYPNRGAYEALEPESFTSAEVCAGCHAQHYAEWSASGMGRSSEVSRFLIDLFELGLDVKGAPVDDVAQCLHCHAPLAVMGPEPDLHLAKALSQEGVTCDVCHTAAVAHANDAPGMIEWDPGGPKRGPWRGSRDVEETPGEPKALSPVHETVYSPLHGSSELCGACHMSLWPTNALPIDWTYAEWRRGPYPAKGQTCQSCHMATYRGRAAPGAPERSLHRHDFPGGGDADFVAKTAEIELQAHAHFAGVEVRVRVENKRSGHAFPTGNATAPVVKLEVRAFDEAGSEVFIDERRYGLVYADAEGRPVTDPSSAVRVLSDTTLGPLEPRHESFFLPHRLGARRVEARLVYQRWNDDIIKRHGALVWEMVSLYLSQGVRLHRLLARLGDLDLAKLQRVRSMPVIVVDEAATELPSAPELPPAFAATGPR